jgi:predicted O-linked N-acetylglucosamine transferase (SPINDLY family)
LIRLSPCAWCFQPGQSPPPAPRPQGPITFGCFNTFAKVSEPMLKIWGRILQAVPESRLLLKSAGLGSASVRQRVQQVLGALGIVPQRLELRGHERDYGGHLALYGRMDLALDTFPYHGTTTTCEAMSMGVPVLSLAGSSHVSRVGVSLLSNVGLPELVAESEQQYIQIAVDLANDPPRLKDLRGSLRPKMAQSPLMDGPRFAGNVEAAYRQMWRRWCERI